MKSKSKKKAAATARIAPLTRSSYQAAVHESSIVVTRRREALELEERQHEERIEELQLALKSEHRMLRSTRERLTGLSAVMGIRTGVM